MSDRPRLSGRATRPARRPLSEITSAVLASVACAVLAGCGPPPPQAPVAQASKISSATTTIAAVCGESYREQAFSASPPLTGLNAIATSSVGTLLTISRHHPGWIYQGSTMTQIDAQSARLLRECGLTGAARVLRGG
jgi:hypothetical protein